MIQSPSRAQRQNHTAIPLARTFFNSLLVVELFLTEFGVAHYRVCTIGLDGNFLSVEEIECANDQKAIQKAQQALGDRNVELWQGDRLIRAAVSQADYRVGPPQLAASSFHGN